MHQLQPLDWLRQARITYSQSEIATLLDVDVRTGRPLSALRIKGLVEGCSHSLHGMLLIFSMLMGYSYGI
jgi:hypothetical protein